MITELRDRFPRRRVRVLGCAGISTASIFLNFG